MTGVVFMIRWLLILILISGCGNLPIAYIQNFSQVNSVVFGFPEYEITNEIYEEYENSFMKIRFGRGPHAIMILAYINDGVYEWVGADDVKIFTVNGRIIRTTGLPHNFELKKYNDAIETSSKSSYELLNLYNPDAYSLKIKRLSKNQKAKIKKLEKMIEVVKIKENFEVDAIGWSDVNLYYQNIDTLQIEMIEQKIHPKLPVVKVEYYLKY